MNVYGTQMWNQPPLIAWQPLKERRIGLWLAKL